MHSALFLPEVDMAAPPTPTGSFGGFWRGNEPGEATASASTNEVVKSECAPCLCRPCPSHAMPAPWDEVQGQIHSSFPHSPGALVGPKAHRLLAVLP